MNDSWLILETSGRTGTVALARGGAVVRSMPLDATRRHARDLAPAMSSVLRLEGLRPTDLTGVMVSVGPGSYTGLRVGVMSAKTLAYATGCKLVATPTFHAIAEQAPAEAENVWVIGDALQGQIYVQRFARDPASRAWTAVSDLRIESFGEWSATAGEGAWVSGPAAGMVESTPTTASRLVSVGERDPRPESVFRVGLRSSPLTFAEALALEPLYLRGSSAEEKAKRPG